MPAMHDPEFDRVAPSPDQESAFLPELEQGEKLIWAGAPRPGARAQAESWSAALGVGFIALALLLLWISMAARSAGSLAVLSLLLIGSGLVNLAAPLRAYRRALRTSYALTDRRAIVIEPEDSIFSPSPQVRSYYPDQLGSPHRSDR